jgi:peptide-methionine (R)-S-oxide reductase
MPRQLSGQQFVFKNNRISYIMSPGTLPLITIALLLAACTQQQGNSQHAAIMNDSTTSSNPYYSRTDTTRLDLPDSEWKRVLTDEVYYIARNKGTERAFTGKYWDFEGKGTYYCAACGNALFRSDSKFASSCGWPSFFEALRPNSVAYHEDNSYGMNRIEVVCGRCSGHLGHIFDDGPPPTGKRFCMNSVVLDFEPEQ